MYTSAKDKRNIDQVYKYMLHRIFGFPFTMPANVVDKDAIFMFVHLQHTGVILSFQTGWLG